MRVGWRQVAGNGLGTVVQDTFLPCFEPRGYQHWNWSFYLFIPWLLGVMLRFCIILPLRLVLLLGGVALFLIMFFSCLLYTSDAADE